jgi:hypothetical protein
MADEDNTHPDGSRTALSVVVLRYGPAADNEPFVGALRKTFLGIDASQGYTASDYELLDPLDFRAFQCVRAASAPRSIFPEIVKNAIARDSEATLLILLLSLADEGAGELLDATCAFVGREDGAFVLAVSLATSAPPPLPGISGNREKGLALGLEDLNERDVRKELLSLQALNAALLLLSRRGRPRVTGEGPTKPTLFISHAKRDGVPLALSIGAWLKTFLAFRFFYDTQDLDLKGDISAQLEQAITGSVLVVLRTEVFEQRYWCQKEIYWAEKHGVPVLAVDGRWSLQHAPSIIVFDSSPSVRIPDGSVVRILMAAMTEALRVGLFRARVRQTAAWLGLADDVWCTVPRFPSLGSLHSATEVLLQTGKKKAPSPPPYYVLHPNPALPDELRQMTGEMAEARLPGCRVLSLDELRLLMPATP